MSVERQRRRGRRLIRLVVALCSLVGIAGSARAGDLQLEAGGLHTAGDYGTGERVDAWESYLRIGYSYTRLSASVTVPVVHVDGPGVPTGAGVVPVSSEEAGTFLPTGPVSSTSGGADTEADATGLGDTRLELRFRVIDEDERGWWPTVSLLGEVKAPTADPDRGLGTGEWDGGGGVILTKNIRALQLRADLRVIAIGEPSDVELEPVVLSGQVSAGWTLPLAVDLALTPFVFAGAQTRIARGGASPLEVGAGAWLAVRRVVVGLSAAAGLTDGSPDLAVGLSIALTWPEVGP